VVTTFNRSLYESTGRTCVQSHRTHNPDYEVHAYVEADDDDLEDMLRELAALGVVGHRLRDDAQLQQLEADLAPYVPRQYGGDADEDVFAPVPRDENGYWRRNMIRWMRKVVAMHAASKDFHGILLWADSDAYAKAPRKRRASADRDSGASVLYLKAGRSFTETGVIGFDLTRPATHGFIRSMLDFYAQQRFKAGTNWSDCIAFDFARTMAGAPPARDVAVYEDRAGHVVAYSPLDPYLAHGKGHHKRSGLYSR
jgi:hypothetical protein